MFSVTIQAKVGFLLANRKISPYICNVWTVFCIRLEHGDVLVLTALMSDSKHAGLREMARKNRLPPNSVANNNYALAA